MSILVAALALPHRELLARAKLGILAGSVFAGMVGCAIRVTAGRPRIGDPRERLTGSGVGLMPPAGHTGCPALV